MSIPDWQTHASDCRCDDCYAAREQAFLDMRAQRDWWESYARRLQRELADADDQLDRVRRRVQALQAKYAAEPTQVKAS